MGKKVKIRFIKWINRTISLFIIRVKWSFCRRIPNWHGTKAASSDVELILSLTSFPDRIKFVHKTIISLLCQKKKPNRIILWLAEEQFLNKEKDIPVSLTALKRYGLEIRWCEDIKSYKKLIPTLRAYPDAIIITADDDIIYRTSMVKQLYNSYVKDTTRIYCHRITKFYLDNKRFKTIPGGHNVWPEASYLHKVTGCGGVLYPPHCFYKDILREDLFTTLCQTNDDIWFWLMGVLNGVKVDTPRHNNWNTDIIEIKDSLDTPALSKINDKGKKLFWSDFGKMLNHYKNLNTILCEEYEHMMSL